MTEQEKDRLADKGTPEQVNLFPDENSVGETENQEGQEKKPLSVADIRNASYFVLTIGAIFVINAMETGSYRTPWPVAIVVSLAGFGLLAYSFVKSNQEKPAA